MAGLRHQALDPDDDIGIQIPVLQRRGDALVNRELIHD